MKPMERTRTIAYVRVSTDKQADAGYSLEAQRAKLEAYAVACDLELVAFESDTASASTLDRPGLQRALEALNTFRAEAILVVKLDRLTRSVRDLGELVDSYFRDGQHQLLSVGESIDTRSAAGRMVLTILMSVCAWEREAIGERTSAAMQHMKAAGRFTGGWPPYGWYVGEEGKLIEHAGEQEMTRVARDMRKAGCSLRSIGVALGRNPRNGRPFAPAQIARML